MNLILKSTDGIRQTPWIFKHFEFDNHLYFLILIIKYLHPPKSFKL